MYSHPQYKTFVGFILGAVLAGNFVASYQFNRIQELNRQYDALHTECVNYYPR